MAYALSAQSRYPIVARYGNVENISVHLVSELGKIRFELDGLDPPVMAYLLTSDVIPDPQDFNRKRETLPDHEHDKLVNQFGLKAFEQHMGLPDYMGPGYSRWRLKST
jgi:hypothetical protein